MNVSGARYGQSSCPGMDPHVTLTLQQNRNQINVKTEHSNVKCRQIYCPSEHQEYKLCLEKRKIV